jgi:uncharacterized protein
MTDREFDGSIVRKTGHRPWPMPDAPWVMTQTWHDLLFAHWPIDPARLRSKVPRRFELDQFDSTAWLGIVPFRMTNVGPRGVPSFPGISAFPELNVRTYVRVDNRPGVYFFSLDAGSSIAVKVARALLNLPYYSARMHVSTNGHEVRYRCDRASGGPAGFSGTYEPTGTRFTAAEGTLEYFLTERYCFYHQHHGGSPYRMEIHHPPWSLQIAQATLSRNTMADASGLSVSGPPALLHFARRQDVVAWMPRRLTA